MLRVRQACGDHDGGIGVAKGDVIMACHGPQLRSDIVVTVLPQLPEKSIAIAENVPAGTGKEHAGVQITERNLNHGKSCVAERYVGKVEHVQRGDTDRALVIIAKLTVPAQSPAE